MTNSTINIRNDSPNITEINIEGTIGVPEGIQFDHEGDRIATFDKFRGEIDRIKSISSPEIVVNIRSGGGNINDALLIYDALAALKGTVTTRCYGYTASAATIIAQAASGGRREMSRNAFYLIHKSVSASEGNSRNMAETIDLLEKTDRRIAAIYASRSERNPEKFMELMECNNGNGRWLSPLEAKEHGLIDRIIPSPETHNYTAIKQQEKPMTIRQHWNAILEAMGIADEKNRSEAPAMAESGLGTDYPNPIAELQNRVQTLEADNARLSAMPTRTDPAEDPSPTEVRSSPNTASYEEDARNFMQ